MWQTFPWGLSGASGQRWVRDQLVIVNPALPPDQRRRQLNVVRSWIPTVQFNLVLATLWLPVLVAQVMDSPWPLLGFAFAAVCLSSPSAVSSILTRHLERVFDKHAPRADRVLLGGATRYGQIDYDAAQLHTTLLDLALEQRRWISGVDQGREARLLEALWEALHEHPGHDLVSLNSYLETLAHPSADAGEVSPCAHPQTCCLHGAPVRSQS